MFLYKIVDSQGITIINSLPSKMDLLVSEMPDGSHKIVFESKEYRIVNKTIEKDRICCVSDIVDMVKSKKTMIKEIDFLFRSIESFKKAYSSVRSEAQIHVNRLVHNLVTLNAHNIQEVYSIIPQEVMQDKRNKWRERIAEHVSKDVYEASLAFVRIAKNTLKMKTEIDVYNALLSGKPNITIKSHELHRVLMNVLYVFFPDFTDKGVYVSVLESNVRVSIDYETFQVAIYHIIENTVKYIRPDSELKISIDKSKDSKKASITLTMNSLQITPDEIEKIFEEGYSGSVAKRCQRAGSGIGLARVKELLSYNEAELIIEANYESAKPSILEHIYQDNIFTIVFL
ncbi:hypothetical protein K5D56_04445 [Pseudomonas cichorii]|nr:hypothetical protein [Pseudomonas cichorii]